MVTAARKHALRKMREYSLPYCYVNIRTNDRIILCQNWQVILEEGREEEKEGRFHYEFLLLVIGMENSQFYKCEPQLTAHSSNLSSTFRNESWNKLKLHKTPMYLYA